MLIFKKDDVAYFACPLGYHKFDARMRIDYTVEDNYDIWHVGDDHGTIAYVCSDSDRVIDLIRYSDAFECEFSRDGMREAISRCKKALKNTNCDMGDEETSFSIVAARGDRVIKAGYRGTIYEIEDPDTIGEVSERIKAAYAAYADVADPVERVRLVYEYVERVSSIKYFPVALISTADKSTTLIHKNKVEKI